MAGSCPRPGGRSSPAMGDSAVEAGQESPTVGDARPGTIGEAAGATMRSNGRTVPPMAEDTTLSMEERTELERLRAEVTTLRSQVQGQGQGGKAGRPTAAGGGRQRWRTIVATLLIVVGCVLAPLSVAAIWTRNQVTNTDRYIATVTPLASDPAIQNAISDQITAQVFSYIDVQGLTNQAVDAELVKALTGEGGGSVTVENDTVSLNLAAFIATVKQRLVDSGFTVAERIPTVNASFVLFQSADVTRARSAFNLLNTLGIWLPIIALVLLAIGVYVAKDHRRALVGAALGVAVGMVVLALGLAVFRSIYLDAVPATVLPHDAAAVLYDTIVRFLRLGLRTILVLALVVAAGAFLSGRSVTAVRTRQGLSNAIGWVAGGAQRAGFSTGPVGTWIYANKRALRITAVAAAALALVFWGRPTGKVVLGLTIALLVVLAVIEFLGRPGQEVAEGSVTSQT